MGVMASMLGVDTGNDDFVVPQIERELAAGIDAEGLPDRFGQRDLASGGQRGDFVDDRHGNSPDCDTRIVGKFLTSSMWASWRPPESKNRSIVGVEQPAFPHHTKLQPNHRDTPKMTAVREAQGSYCGWDARVPLARAKIRERGRLARFVELIQK
jgi:hypothetical protein